MYDKDIFLMQVLLSCMDKDYFLHVVLEMFKLLPWSSSSYNVDKSDEIRINQELALAGEFLHLLIIILGEH
ncbi:Hypothetical predicted protein [Paramuricea clavata]|uniref:E3 ubiquitin-protein ligase n=2 Tax=Paramuricea clavata TaxID=317549 RepID=A0A7D9LWJ8_PARCT|nr:Hypothetical predicted protein [Paramuricea clavata]